MSASNIKAGEAYVVISAKLDQLRADLKQANGELGGMGKRFSGLGAAVGTAFASIGAAAVGGVIASVKAFADAGGAIDDMAKRTGFSVKQVQELGYAAKLGGSSMETLERAAASFVNKGGNIANFEAVGQGIASIRDPSERARAAFEAFGKSGRELLPMFEDLTRLKEQARAIGPIFSEQEIEAAARLGDSMDALSEASKRAMQQIGSTFSTEFRGVLDTLTGALASFSDALRSANSFGQGGDLLDTLGKWNWEATKTTFGFGSGEFAARGASASQSTFAQRLAADLARQDEATAKLFEEAAKKQTDIPKMIEAGNKARIDLIRQFETPAERFLRRQQEIIDAMKALNNNKVLGFVNEQEAAGQKAGLQTALARLRQEEHERRMALMPTAREEVVQQVARVQSSTAGTFSGAAAGLLGRGGDGIIREQKEQTRVLRSIEKKIGEAPRLAFT